MLLQSRRNGPPACPPYGPVNNRINNFCSRGGRGDTFSRCGKPLIKASAAQQVVRSVEHGRFGSTDNGYLSLFFRHECMHGVSTNRGTLIMHETN